MRSARTIGKPGTPPAPTGHGPRPHAQLLEVLAYAATTYPDTDVCLVEYESNHGYRIAAKVKRGDIPVPNPKRWTIWATGTRDPETGVMATTLWGHYTSPRVRAPKTAPTKPRHTKVQA